MKAKPVSEYDALLKKIHALLPRAMASERQQVRRKLYYIRKNSPGPLNDETILKKLASLEKRLKASKKIRDWRKNNHPPARYPTLLPILDKKDEIVSAIKQHAVLIVSGETGSGKTTQIPKFCLEAKRGINGKIGCTQPRRIAAITVSDRIAEELGEAGDSAVGYKIRFTDKTRKNIFIKIMTDGILLAETQKDPFLYEYDTLIVDEAHERSLNIDFVLGILKTLLKKRKDLKLIITSATIDTEKFSRAFGDAPIIEVSGRTYPVDVRYMAAAGGTDNDDDASYVERAVDAVDYLQRTRTRGDILIFMPTEQDILETRELIEGRKYPHVTVMPLFARLSGKDQTRVFARIPGRKIIIATNIAETSITIPGIKYVIDTGLARIPRYSPRTRTTSLPVSPISRSSADQRKGRCGRVENGVCIRLYSEEDYMARPLYTLPEILRANLAEVILRMISLNLGEISEFPFIDPPAPKSISDGFDLLTELGAIVRTVPGKKSRPKGRFALTPKGRLMARLPVDPRISCMLIEAQKQGCPKEILVIAAVLSIMDPRERPVDKAQAADEKHAAFKDPSSDFLTLLNIWDRYDKTKQMVNSNTRMKRFCKENYLSYRRMREWRDIHGQLADILEEAGLIEQPPVQRIQTDPENKFNPLYAAIHKSILSGFLSNIAARKENNIYKAPKGREVMIFPGSTLFGKAVPWIVAGEIVETSRVYARTVGAIDDKWLKSAGRGLCTYTWHNPRWDRRRGEVIATEQVSLFGLIIVSGRTVPYGRINPKEASSIFIQKALVEGEMDDVFPFMQFNKSLVDNVRTVENKLRKRDILIGEPDIFSFYESRLGECYDIRTLRHVLKEKGNDSFLRMKQEDLFRFIPDADELALYPDRVKLGNKDFACEYRFDPGKNDDGLTVKVPLSLAAEIPGDELDWLVPGLYKEKITALIKGLPKSYRKQLVPVGDTVDTILSEMPKTRISLLTALGNFIHKRFGVDIPARAWSVETLPDYLKMRIAITGNKGMEIRSGRDKSVLARADINGLRTDVLFPIKKEWERTGIIQWDFSDLPESVRYKDKDGTNWILYPALEVAEKREKEAGPQPVNLRLFLDFHKARNTHKAGVAALYANYFSKDLKFLKKALTLPGPVKDAVKQIGGKKTIEAYLYDRVLYQLFHKDIRTEVDFKTHAAAAGPVILKEGQKLLKRVIPLLTARHETKGYISRLKAENRFNPVVFELIDELDTQVDRLVPENFLSLYDADRFDDIQRYLKAIVIRAQRALVSLEKDRVKARGIKVFTNRLDEFLASLTPETSRDKKDAIESLFWLIEEYKVSVFAQELKTAIKISPKKLNELINNIDRMV